MPTDSEKVARVDAWLDAVAKSSERWNTAKEAQRSVERVIAHLENVRARVRDVPPDLEERMAEAVARNRENAMALADEAVRQSELEGGFYAVLPHVEPPGVAEAWRMRCIGGKTWLQCSMALHYNRQHLERLSKRAKVEVYGLIPEAFRHGEGE